MLRPPGYIRFLLLMMVLIIPLSASSLAENKILPLYFQGRQVGSQAGKFGAEYYLPLAFFSDSLRAAVLWNDDSGEIKLQMGSLVVEMKEGETEVTWGREKKKLKVPPCRKEEENWLPLEVAVALGLKEETREDGLSLSWRENYLLFIQDTTYEGRPAYLLQTTGSFTYDSFLLENPGRLVIDLKGVIPFPYLNRNWQLFEGILGIRTGMFSKEKMRVVFDLSRLIGYKISKDPDDPSRLMVIFNSVLKDVGYLSNADDPKVFIDTSHPVRYRTTVAFDPHRLIVDIWDVTLTGKALIIPGDGDWVDRIRISQFDPQTIRVVLEVKEPRSCVVAYSRQVKNRLEIKTIQKITALSWQDAPYGGGVLHVKSTGELEEEITRAKDPDRLLISLHHAVIGPGVKAPGGKGSRVKLRQEEGALVSVEIVLLSESNYNVRFSEDRREMTLTVERSPLGGRVILLDPGHGGIDAGAIGSQGLREKEVNLEVSLRLRKYLEEAGAQVVMTRDDDRYVGLYERAAIANRVAAALTLSIHANFHPDPKVQGFEAFHHPEREDSRLLAEKIFAEVIEGTGLKPLSVKASKDLVLTRETQMPAVLIEMGFLSNYQEEAILNTAEFKDKMAMSIFKGIVNYCLITESPMESSSHNEG